MVRIDSLNRYRGQEKHKHNRSEKERIMNGSNFQKYKFSSGFKFREATRREEEES